MSPLAALALAAPLRAREKVVSATRSPLNLARWHVTLTCGHERWVTSQRMPRTVKCDVCGTKEKWPQRPSVCVKSKVPR